MSFYLFLYERYDWGSFLAIIYEIGLIYGLKVHCYVSFS